jgi:hypothetical protein
MQTEDQEQSAEILSQSPQISDSAGRPCKRCITRSEKVLGKRKRRHAHDIDLEQDGYASLNKIKYRCDVGLKSLLRSVSDFYQNLLQTYSNE